MTQPEIRQGPTPDRLVIAWDNRRVAKQGCLTFVLPLFWCFWTAATIYGTWWAITDSNREWLGLVMVGFAYLGVIGIPLTWLLRYTEERVEIDSREFRHYFVKYPWFSPIRWPLSEISHIEIGHYVNPVGETDAVVTLKVYAGEKRCMVAYWADDEFKHRVFQAIRDHLRTLNSSIECHDNMYAGAPKFG